MHVESSGRCSCPQRIATKITCLKYQKPSSLQGTHAVKCKRTMLVFVNSQADFLSCSGKAGEGGSAGMRSGMTSCADLGAAKLYSSSIFCCLLLIGSCWRTPKSIFQCTDFQLPRHLQNPHLRIPLHFFPPSLSVILHVDTMWMENCLS